MPVVLPFSCLTVLKYAIEYCKESPLPPRPRARETHTE